MSISNDNLAGLVDDDGERTLPQEFTPEAAKTLDGYYSRPGHFSTLRYSNGGKDFDYREVFAFKGHYPARA